VLGAEVGLVWAAAGPPRATSVRPRRKRGLDFITGKKGKGEDTDRELYERSVNRSEGELDPFTQRSEALNSCYMYEPPLFDVSVINVIPALV
jgi:hypothetical protein